MSFGGGVSNASTASAAAKKSRQRYQTQTLGQDNVDSFAESAATVDANQIGKFRPDKNMKLNQIESVGTYRPES